MAVLHMSAIFEDQRPGWTMSYALFSDFLQSLFDSVAQRGADADVKTASDKSEPQGFACHFREPDTNAAEDAFAGLEDHIAILELLFEWLALVAEPIRLGMVQFRVVLQGAIADRSAVAMQTASGFRSGGTV